ncbi:hypothetical protein [Streptomyces sp. XH2]|uniref:hypothetical protein n=1 Tax=Streptomyces sp. XH2 TaxID=3412483 RepID=UPI003C798B74
MRMLVLADDPAAFLLTPRPAPGDADCEYEPLPPGLTLNDAVLLRAHQVRAGDLVVAEFSEDRGAGRVAAHIPAPYPADPHFLSACPCDGCEECEDFDASGFADPQTAIDRDARWLCLAPSVDGEPCAVAFRNAPLAVIPAATAQARTGQPTA